MRFTRRKAMVLIGLIVALVVSCNIANYAVDEYRESRDAAFFIAGPTYYTPHLSRAQAHAPFSILTPAWLPPEGGTWKQEIRGTRRSEQKGGHDIIWVSYYSSTLQSGIRIEQTNLGYPDNADIGRTKLEVDGTTVFHGKWAIGDRLGESVHFKCKNLAVTVETSGMTLEDTLDVVKSLGCGPSPA